MNQQFVSLLVQVNSVDRIMVHLSLEEFACEHKQVHELHALFVGNVFHGGGVQLQSSIVFTAVRKIRIPQVFVGDRTEQDQPGSGLTVVFLPLQMIDVVCQVLAERRQSFLAGE